MRRWRGVRSLTTTPPMRISPDVGSSSPAIIRRSVVLPDPEGPRRTRNSPSRLSRSTLTTAPSCPLRKSFVSPLVSTIAIRNRSRLLPLVEDPPDLLFSRAHRIFRAHDVLSAFREHRGKDERVEDLVD